MEHDAAIKRATFIRSSVEIRETFKFAAPAEVLKALKIHSNSFYGSCLWDLGGEKAKQVLNAWNYLHCEAGLGMLSMDKNLLSSTDSELWSHLS